MPSSVFGHVPDQSLESFLKKTITPHLLSGGGDVDLSLDVDPDIEFAEPADRLASLVESVVMAAIHEMSNDGELLVTAVQTDRGLELEIADDGSPVKTRFQWRPLEAAKMGATLRWQDCPQGGAAVTITMPLPADSIAHRQAA